MLTDIKRAMVFVWCWLKALYLRWRIWEHNHYTRDAERSGVHTSLDLAAFRAEERRLRVLLIDAERGFT